MFLDEMVTIEAKDINRVIRLTETVESLTKNSMEKVFDFDTGFPFTLPIAKGIMESV
jgi:hypothetical protein